MCYRYMVLISMVSALYALIAAVFSWIRSIATKAWLFFLTDQVPLCSFSFTPIRFFFSSLHLLFYIYFLRIKNYINIIFRIISRLFNITLFFFLISVSI